MDDGPARFDWGCFKDDYIDQIFADNVRYYYNPTKVPPRLSNLFAPPVSKQWAREEVYEKHKPVRPWGLGEIYESEIGFVRAPPLVLTSNRGY